MRICYFGLVPGKLFHVLSGWVQLYIDFKGFITAEISYKCHGKTIFMFECTIQVTFIVFSNLQTYWDCLASSFQKHFKNKSQFKVLHHLQCIYEVLSLIQSVRLTITFVLAHLLITATYLHDCSHCQVNILL